jgi:alkylhydroperoxidase family enzyme
VDISLRAGLSAEDIVRVSQGPDVDGGDELEAAIIRAADELHASRMLSDNTWKVLSQHFDEKKMIELIMLIGCYGALAGLLNSAGVQLEVSVDHIMKSTPIHC